MAAAAFAGLLSGLQNQKRCEDAVAQADDGIADFALFVETRDLEVEFASDTHGPVQTSLASDQSDIIPHRVLDRQPILSDEGGVCRFVFVPPVRHLGKVETVASRDALGGLRPSPRSPNQAFQQRRAGQAVGTVQSGACDFARRPQPVHSRSAAIVGSNAAAAIVHGGDHRDWFAREVDAALDAHSIDPGKTFAKLIGGLVCDVRLRKDFDQMLSQVWPEIAPRVYDSAVFLESD